MDTKINSTKIIGLDMDGVIIDHTKSRIDLARRFGIKLKAEETHPEIIKTIIDKPILDKIKDILYHEPDFTSFSPLMIGAKIALKKIKKQKLPFFLISRRIEPEVAVKTLKFYNLWPEFFNNKNTFFVAEAEDKNIKAKELGITHYIDDELEIIKKLLDVKNKFLFDYLNIFNDSKNYKRVNSWEKLTEHILK